MIKLLELCQTNEQYDQNLQRELDRDPKVKISKPLQKIIDVFKNLDLTPVHEILSGKYRPCGRISRDPIVMFRAIMLMFFFRMSVTAFVGFIRFSPIIAAICGFIPGDTAGVGTFYDYFTRLWDSSSKNISRTHILPRKHPPEQPKNKGEKAPSIESETLDEKIERLSEKGAEMIEKIPFMTLLIIFKIIFLSASIKAGLVKGDILSGDGTPLPTSARERSHRACPMNHSDQNRCLCTKRDKSDCPFWKGADHKKPCEEEDWKNRRYYSQPDTDAGYDSSRNCYYIGYDVYVITDARTGIPLLIVLNPASKHDSHAFVEAKMIMGHLLKEIYPDVIVLDSAHDADGIYKLLEKEGIRTVIDLNKRGAGNIHLPNHFTRNENGLPICPRGYLMTRSGTDKKEEKALFRCPKLRPDGTGKLCCTCDAPCSKSKKNSSLSVPLNMIAPEYRPFKKRVRFGFEMSPNGVPVCPEGHEMKPIGNDKFLCPMMVTDEDGTPQCTCKAPCSKAKTGRIVTLLPETPEPETDNSEKSGSDFKVGKDGVPICEAGLRMKQNGNDLQRNCALFRCPLTTRNADGTTTCTCETPCSSSKYGKSVRIPRTDSFRFYSIPPRESEEWKQLYNKRTASERCNKSLKNDRKLGDVPFRSTKMWYIGAYIDMMLIHALRLDTFEKEGGYDTG